MFGAGTSDLAGQLVGAFVSTAMVFKNKDPKYYDKLMTEARDLYSAAVGRKKAYSAPFIYPCAPPVSTSTAAPLCTTQHMHCVLPVGLVSLAWSYHVAAVESSALSADNSA